jgi:hypothetical protein
MRKKILFIVTILTACLNAGNSWLPWSSATSTEPPKVYFNGEEVVRANGAEWLPATKPGMKVTIPYRKTESYYNGRHICYTYHDYPTIRYYGGPTLYNFDGKLYTLKYQNRDSDKTSLLNRASTYFFGKGSANNPKNGREYDLILEPYAYSRQLFPFISCELEGHYANKLSFKLARSSFTVKTEEARSLAYSEHMELSDTLYQIFSTFSNGRDLSDVIDTSKSYLERGWFGSLTIKLHNKYTSKSVEFSGLCNYDLFKSLGLKDDCVTFESIPRPTMDSLLSSSNLIGLIKELIVANENYKNMIEADYAKHSGLREDMKRIYKGNFDYIENFYKRHNLRSIPSLNLVPMAKVKKLEELRATIQEYQAGYQAKYERFAEADILNKLNLNWLASLVEDELANAKLITEALQMSKEIGIEPDSLTSDLNSLKEAIYKMQRLFNRIRERLSTGLAALPATSKSDPKALVLDIVSPVLGEFLDPTKGTMSISASLNELLSKGDISEWLAGQVKELALDKSKLLAELGKSEDQSSPNYPEQKLVKKTLLALGHLEALLNLIHSLSGDREIHVARLFRAYGVERYSVPNI